MKTAEEFYKEYYPPKMHLFRDKHDRELQLFSINDLLAFAEYVSNAKLQEAAEKAEYLKSETEVTDYCKGYNHAINIVKSAVLSLIPKEHE